MKTASVVSFRYNRTVIALNWTFCFKIDIGSKLEVKHFQLTCFFYPAKVSFFEDGYSSFQILQ